MATPTDSHRPPDETDSGPEHGSGETAQKAGPERKYWSRILGKTMPTDSHRPPDETDSRPEYGSGDSVQKAGDKGKYRSPNVENSHPAGPSVVDTVVDNPSDGKELRSEHQEALAAEDCRETPTVENKFTPPQFRIKVMFELDARAQRQEVRLQYNRRPKISAQVNELPHTLQVAGRLVTRKEVFGEPTGQAKSEFHTSPIPSTSQSTKVPSEVGLNLAVEIKLLHGTPESLHNMHRQMKQSSLEFPGFTNEVKIQRGTMEGDPKADVKQVTDTGNEVLPAGTETGFGDAQGKLNANEPDRPPTRNNVISTATGGLTKCDKLTNICENPRKFLHVRNEIPEMLNRPIVVLRAKTETTSGATKEAPVERPEVRFQYGKRPKTSAQMKELPNTLQEAGCLVSFKEAFGEPGGQAKSEVHTSTVPFSSQSTKVASEVSPNLAAKVEMLYGTRESLYNVHRQMKPYNLESPGFTDEVKIQRGTMEGDPKADVKQVTDTGNEVLPAGTETGFGDAQGKLNANEPDRAPTRNNVISTATGVLTKCDKLTNICENPRKFLHVRNEIPEMLNRPIVVLRAKTETTSGATKEAPVERPEVRFQYDKRPKTSAQMKELPHTLQESGCLVSCKEVFGEPGGQAKVEFHTSPVPSSSQSTKFPWEVSPNLAAKVEMLYGTRESLHNVHRQMKQSNLEYPGFTDEVKIQRGAMEGDPKADVKQVTDTGNEVLPAGTETGFADAQGKLNANEPDRAPTRKNVASLVTDILTKCDKLTNICGKPRKFLHNRNELLQMLNRPSVVLRAKTETTSGTTKYQLNMNERDTIPIRESLVSLALGVLTKCQKMANICKEITNVFPEHLLPRIMVSSKYPILHPILCFMLIEISFLIIKLLSELMSALMSLIYVIIHKGIMNIVPDVIIDSLDTLMISLPSLETKYKILCTNLMIDVKILTPEELDVAVQENQTENMQTDMCEQTGVSGEKTDTPSQLFQTPHEQDEACSAVLLEVPRCSLPLLVKDSIKMRLWTVGLTLELMEQKIVTALKNPSEYFRLQ
ncbi:uncharacterized protein LOC111866450 isoform X5 [Cryptotermes secundus]|uniref:uncharacterized protein LOC111866450 isoform X5 n=1 Tax=Cryptotermes secundus TaxID=105785 RepID=UPI000CD7AB68|nr:uncharacterized protein LOC111866450 isoform X5 [Cryptotermes secundus]